MGETPGFHLQRCVVSSILFVLLLLHVQPSIQQGDPPPKEPLHGDLSVFNPYYECREGSVRDGAPTPPEGCDQDRDGIITADESKRYDEVLLQFYVVRGNLTGAEELVLRGVDVNAPGVRDPRKVYGISRLDSYLPALHLAVYRANVPEHAQIAAMLIEAGAYTGQNYTRHHRSALSYAWEFYFSGQAENIDLRQNMVSTLYMWHAEFPLGPLQYASRLGCVDCVAAISQHGLASLPRGVSGNVEVNNRNNENMTALFYAIDVRCDDCIGHLLANGARVDIQDSYGRNPLHHAVYLRSPASIQALLAGKGGDVALTQKDRDGRTPVDFAKLHRAVPKVLQALGVTDFTPETKTRDRGQERDRGGWAWTDSTPLDTDRCDFDRYHVDDLSVEDFLRNYYSVGRPVVITGLTDNWHAWSHWVRDSFDDRYGNVSLMTGPIPYASEYGRPTDTEKMAIHEWLDEMGEGTPEVFKTDIDESNEPWILFDQNVATEQPKFLEDYHTPEYFRICNMFTRPQLSVGSFGSGAPFHSHVAAWNAVIYGRKRWLLVPPGIAKQVDVETSTQPLMWYQSKRYAELRDSGDLQECVQYPGEVVYVPRLWSHATINLADTVCMAQEFCVFSPNSDPLSNMVYGPSSARENTRKPVESLYTLIRGPVQAVPDHVLSNDNDYLASLKPRSAK